MLVAHTVVNGTHAQADQREKCPEGHRLLVSCHSLLFTLTPVQWTHMDSKDVPAIAHVHASGAHTSNSLWLLLPVQGIQMAWLDLWD